MTMPGKTAKRALFAIDKHLMFGQVREDSAVDKFLIGQLESPQRVFVIASGGCTALSILSTASIIVDALDISRAQIALVELKLVLLKVIGFEAARKACREDARAVYELDDVRSTLTSETREILDSYKSYFQYGLNNCGWVDRRMRKITALFYLFVHTRTCTNQFLQLTDKQDQLDFYRSKWCNWQWRLALTAAFSIPFLTLVHGKAAMQLVPADFSRVMEARLTKALTGFPNATNPYVWQAFFARYNTLEECLPPYLQKSSADMMIANLKNLNLVCQDTLQWFQKQTANTFDYIGLSNIIELLPAEYAAALETEIKRCARPGALVCVRAIFPRKTAVFGCKGAGGSQPELVLDRLLSEQCAKMDQSLFCNFYEIYRRA